MTMPTKKAFLPLLLIIMLSSGCGFQLRGKVELPEGVEPLFIGGLKSSDQLAIELRNLLTAYGVALTEDGKEANYRLNILEQKDQRRNATLGQKAKVAEYLLIEQVSFELLNNKGKRVLGPNRLIERKIMPNDPNKVVSTKDEEDLLRREMLQNLAGKIARQLRNFDYSSQPQTEPESEPQQ
ncbi:LPS assembly lipoprotein LptE [Oceanicoccus sagamiensis]|uniref:LPS-assembly lipoprotein LptE n=1 Tax=Oceanicoccus sagamiensis TaxID=716816 RepID=A0A1X9NCC6_9GAMM|nr:LPS assembly lipoprotein LptE [Oceanicoccus sagamiensis]ARN74694.1 hypothetical protein BST96_11525 [Oceanicoccus sagamiensis]